LSLFALQSHCFEAFNVTGDAVLGFVLGLNAMARNSSLIWDGRDIQDIISSAGKNEELAPAALRIGLPRIVRACSNPMQRRHSESWDLLDFLCRSNGLHANIPDSVAADLFESVLAAIFLWGRGINDERGLSTRFIIDLLNQARLPFPSNSTNSAWFALPDFCIKSGCVFDPQWRIQLETLSLTWNENKFTGLGVGITLFLRKLDLPSGQSQILQTLLFCALFNDHCDEGQSTHLAGMTALDGQHAEPINRSRTQTIKSKIHVQLVRMCETLYHVGACGLQLLLTEEVYRRFPSASENDLHLLRAVALTDDVIAYVMVKSDLPKTLLDKQSPVQHLFEEADIFGQSIWEMKGGWIIGIEEFNRRTNGTNRHRPQYPGIGGGRLCSRAEKLPQHLTEGLVLAFKAVFGALVLGLGLDRTWDFIGDMFDELLLLSPQEVRELFGTSSLVLSHSRTSI
jgi:dsRNA-specific ribonuclease